MNEAARKDSPEIVEPTPSVTGAAMSTGGATQRFKAPKLAHFSLPQGHITFEWWIPLTPEDVKDIQDWLKIVERQIIREGVRSGQCGEGEKPECLS